MFTTFGNNGVPADANLKCDAGSCLAYLNSCTEWQVINSIKIELRVSASKSPVQSLQVCHLLFLFWITFLVVPCLFQFVTDYLSKDFTLTASMPHELRPKCGMQVLQCWVWGLQPVMPCCRLNCFWPTSQGSAGLPHYLLPRVKMLDMPPIISDQNLWCWNPSCRLCPC